MWATGAILVFLLVLYVGLLAPRLPYATFSPGSAPTTENLIAVQQGVPVYLPDEDDGRVLFTTVSIHYSAEPWRLIQAWRSPTIDILRMEKVTGGRPASEQEKANQAMMKESKDTAVVVALRYLGYPLVGHGVFVGALVEGSDAVGKLQPGDVISGVDGQPVQFLDDLTTLLTGRPPGDVVSLHIEPAADGFDVRDVEITLTPAPDDPNRGLIGVTELVEFDLDLPFDVTIDSGRVGGPSAGLAFTLGVIDVLTPGDLAGGHIVATTGTINPNGTVGLVGGVAQKVEAAEEPGADVFLVPSGEYETALEHADADLKVIKVDTLDQALQALASIGGEPVEGPDEAASG